VGSWNAVDAGRLANQILDLGYRINLLSCLELVAARVSAIERRDLVITAKVPGEMIWPATARSPKIMPSKNRKLRSSDTCGAFREKGTSDMRADATPARSPQSYPSACGKNEATLHQRT